MFKKVFSSSICSEFFQSPFEWFHLLPHFFFMPNNPTWQDEMFFLVQFSWLSSFALNSFHFQYLKTFSLEERLMKFRKFRNFIYLLSDESKVEDCEMRWKRRRFFRISNELKLFFGSFPVFGRFPVSYEDVAIGKKTEFKWPELLKGENWNSK